MTRRRVFITGATSGIVSRLVARLDSERYQLVGLSRSDAVVPGFEQMLTGDLLTPDSWRQHLAGVELVLHAAAVTHSRVTAIYDRVNRQATADLVDAASEQGVRRFVFVSSRAAVVNSGAYGESKLAAERYVRERFSNHLIVRPAEVFGVDRGEGVEKLIRDAIDRRIHLYPGNVPSPLRPIHVDDLVAAILKKLDPNSPGGETVTICGPQAYSFQSLIRAVGEWTGRSKWLIPVPRAAVAAVPWVATRLGARWGPVPDQVPRLYAQKPAEVDNPPPVTVSLRQYVQSLVDPS